MREIYKKIAKIGFAASTMASCTTPHSYFLDCTKETGPNHETVDLGAGETRNIAIRNAQGKAVGMVLHANEDGLESVRFSAEGTPSVADGRVYFSTSGVLFAFKDIDKPDPGVIVEVSGYCG